MKPGRSGAACKRHSRTCACKIKRWASREPVAKELEKLYTQAIKNTGKDGISQSVVTVNNINYIIEEQNISTVHRIVIQLGGTYHGSIIVFR